VPAFEKPRFRFGYDVESELKALRGYSSQPGKEDRAIPRKAADRLLLATWNIANFGLQERRPDDHRLIAEILGWFDFVAIQEVHDNLAGLRAVQDLLPRKYRVLFNDAGGNQERFAFLFDSTKFKPLEEIGELTVAASSLSDVRLADVASSFSGFDRNPFITTFGVPSARLTFANVHLYFGDDGAAGMDRRVLEAYAVARWADLRRGSKHAFAKDVVALGDFNLPKRRGGDRVYDALVRRGLVLPEHATKVGGSNTRDDADYDQMAVFPGPIKDAIDQVGIFDFDGAVFRELWGDGSDRDQKRFFAYVQYYLSDHRPLWMSLKV
jgi:endonuclease/exonuclease/phosphatase family metal-dependent hydrolase